MAKYLITGANGFVGSAVARKLISLGHCVRLFDLPGNPSWSQWEGISVERCEGDIRDGRSVASAMAGCTHVVHTAALLNSVAPRSVFDAINAGGTRTLCEAAIAAGITRLVYVSTSDVFGLPTDNGAAFDETSPYREWNEPYADTKIAATKAVLQASAQGLNAVVVFPGWVYGPGDQQFFPAIMDMIRGGVAFTWHKRDPYEINLIHIEDLSRGIIAALHADDAPGNSYLMLCTNTGITPRIMFDVIAGQMGKKVRVLHIPYPVMYFIATLSQSLARRGWIKKPLLSTTDVKAFGHAFRFAPTSAKSSLGWEPHVDSRTGVIDAVQWQLNRQPRPDR